MQRPVTVVTGTTRGIGAATAHMLAEAGHCVIGTGRKRPENTPGPFYEVDFADADATAEVLARIVAEHEVDHLVNNAGVSQARSLEDTTVADMDLHYQVNLRAAVQCTQAVVPGMKAKGRGRIVNLSSRVVLGRADRTPYAAAKAGLLSLSRGWALELAAFGITVNTIAPGPVRTALFDRNHPPGSEAYNALLKTVPSGRFGTPEEIAAPIAFLLSDGAAYINGQVLYVCGGASVGSAPV
ncbi:SDR family oxidoreductase [Arenibacterium halophilum]|uniref:SDR family oxidoreductase n=1 Tax=Arenibacterium halophilum TaxID=2583821 RepID=A0ABY2WY91_9RHOB|nr:SDR family oxidoreductase [Arenibacterium halophilum]TMV07475.1 SDR family oxidoreductase [Arenibacterium halophilum]